MSPSQKNGEQCASKRPTLEFIRVRKSFGPAMSVLRDISFALHSGELAVLVGENGAGKTTAFNLASGFIRPDGGRILLHGGIVNGRTPESLVTLGLRRMHQTPTVFRSLSIQDAVLIGKDPALYGSFRPWPRRARRDALWDEVRRRAAPLFRICPFLDHRSSTTENLSFGQQRIIDFLRVFSACGPRTMLLLDEPLAGAHPEVKDVMWEMIVQAVDVGATALMIEHEYAAERLDRCRNLHLVRGELT